MPRTKQVWPGSESVWSNQYLIDTDFDQLESDLESESESDPFDGSLESTFASMFDDDDIVESRRRIRTIGG